MVRRLHTTWHSHKKVAMAGTVEACPSFHLKSWESLGLQRRCRSTIRNGHRIPALVLKTPNCRYLLQCRRSMGHSIGKPLSNQQPRFRQGPSWLKKNYHHWLQCWLQCCEIQIRLCNLYLHLTAKAAKNHGKTNANSPFQTTWLSNPLVLQTELQILISLHVHHYALTVSWQTPTLFLRWW